MYKSLIAIALLAVPFGETRLWEVSRHDAFSRGDDFENVVLNSKGELRVGYESSSVDVKDEPSFWAGFTSASGAVWAGTGKGTIYKIEGGKAEKNFETGEMLVTSFAESDGAVYASTIPNGKIFKQDGATWKEFAKLESKFVWQIVPAKGGGVYAACGGEGRIYQVTAGGAVTKIFPETAESPLKCENVLSLRVDGEGIVAGTAAPGFLIRIENNKSRVLADFGEGEVKSAVATKAGWYVAVNSGNKAPPSEFLGAVEQAAKKEVDPKDPKAPEDGGAAAPPPAPAPGAGPNAGIQSAIWRIAPARTERVAEFPASYVTELAANGDGVLVGTNNSGRIFQIFADGTNELAFDFKEGQVLGFVYSKGKVSGAFTGNRAAMKTFATERAKKGTYVSEVLDAKFPTDWGTISWRAGGKVSVQTRSGFIAKAGEGWTDWASPTGDKVASPKGRFLQFRVVLEEQDSVVRGVSVAYRSENQKPRVHDLKVQTVPSRSDGMMAPQNQEPGPSPRLGEGHSLLKRLQWQGQDDDNDYIVYRIYIRPADGATWTSVIGKGTTPMPEFQWSTENTPDGKYMIKVVASDEKANSTDEALTGEMETEPFLVDNTKPDITVDSIGEKIAVTVEDKASNVTRFEYSIDGGEWNSAAPKDRIFDDKKEQFEFSFGKLSNGTHAIVIKAMDQESNVATLSKNFEVK